MTPLAAALAYAEKFGWPIFPLGWEGQWRRRPLLRRSGERGSGGFYQATRDPAQMNAWWREYPRALIGTPTGRPSGLIVLDIDCKADCDGYATLEQLGRSILPETPIGHTPSGGNHLFFARTAVEIRNSQGKHGLGVGLDVRGEGGYIPLPTPGTGYVWDPLLNPDTVPFVPAPAWFAHRKRSDRSSANRPGTTFDPEASLEAACDAIRNADRGERHHVLNRETFVIGTFVGARLLPEAESYRQLRDAAMVMAARTGGNDKKTEADLADAFHDGIKSPRRPRR